MRLDLPAGTYALRATRFSPDGMQFAESNVTVPDHDIPGPPLHFASVPGVPVEIVADASSTQVTGAMGARNGTPPGVMQLNVSLESLDTDPGSLFQFDIRPTQQRDGSTTLAAPPGVYRLNAGLAAGWYIRSATSRGTDLLLDDLLIAPGSNPSPITLTVSNQTGTLQGKVSLSGAAAACWIYLIATGPALPSVIVRRSDASGVFRIDDLPPGSYHAVAFPYRHSANLQDPAVLQRFAASVGEVAISAGTTTTMDLDAVTVKELQP